MAGMGTQETDLAPTSSPESSHRDSESQKQPVVTEYNLPLADMAAALKRPFNQTQALRTGILLTGQWQSHHSASAQSPIEER
jgi:hypothetical protein